MSRFEENFGSHSNVTMRLRLPSDIVWMHRVSVFLLSLASLVVVAVFCLWVLRQPNAGFTHIQLHGETTHQNHNTMVLKKQLQPFLQAGFYAADLQKIQTTLQTLPWVKQAVVRRRFPQTIDIHLQEHQAVAVWKSLAAMNSSVSTALTTASSTLLNEQGQVFSIDLDSFLALHDKKLPILSAENHPEKLLEMHQSLSKIFSLLNLKVNALTLSTQGNWHIQLQYTNADGVVVYSKIDAGEGGVEQITVKIQRFVSDLRQRLMQQSRSIADFEYADLRYAQGYALKLLAPVVVSTSSDVTSFVATSCTLASRAINSTNSVNCKAHPN